MQGLVSKFLCISYLVSPLYLDMDQGTIGSMRKLGVTESYKLKRQVILSASEAAEMIIRYVCCFRTGVVAIYRFTSVDDILRAAPRRREAV